MKKVAVSIHADQNFTPDLISGLKDIDYIHVDIMDGKFVNTRSDNLDILLLLKNNSDIPIIAHLMVLNPIDYLPKLAENIDIFVFHYESLGDKEKIIKKVKLYSKKIGIAINPDTKLEKILPFLNKIDFVLIMSVFPGKSGQEFIWDTLDKINLLFAYRLQHNLKFQIDVDGGINSENAKFINADILTSASAILNAENPNSIIQTLKNTD